MPNIVVGLGNEIIGVDNYDIYISDCLNELVFVTGITYNDFPYTVNNIESFIPGYDCCYQWVISGDTGCICEGVNNTCSLTPTPTNTITPTITPSPDQSPTPTTTPTVTLTPTKTTTPTVTITPTITRTVTITPTITKTSTPSNTVTPTVTISPQSSQTSTPTNTVTPTITPTITPTQKLFFVSISGCCDGDVLSAIFEFTSPITVGKSFYWTGSQTMTSQCYVITAIGPLTPGTPIATISTVYDDCPACTASNVCPSPTPTKTSTPTVTPTNTNTPTNTPSVTQSPTIGSTLRRLISCCNPNVLEYFGFIPSNILTNQMILATDGQCYQVMGPTLNTPANVVYASTSETTNCAGCLAANPCASPTPTPTPTSTPLYYYKLAPCCDYGQGVNVYVSVSSSSIPNGLDGQVWILDGVAYTINGPVPGSSNYTAGSVAGPYTNCNQAFDSGTPQQSCVPDPTSPPACDCRKGITVDYACNPTQQGTFCPPVTIQYTDCLTNEEVQFQLDPSTQVGIPDCAISDTVQCISNLAPQQVVSVDIFAGDCCGEDVPEGYVLWTLRSCVDASTGYMLGPNTLSSGNFVLTTDGTCWYVDGLGGQNPTHTFLTVDNGCCS